MIFWVTTSHNKHFQKHACSCAIFRGCGHWMKMGCTLVQPPEHLKITHKQGHAFAWFSDHGRSFSKATTKLKALCEPEQPWVALRDMSKEREHCLKLSSAADPKLTGP